MVITLIDGKNNKTFTPLEISNSGGGEVFSVTGGFKESQPTTFNTSSEVKIKMVTSEHPVNPDVSSFIYANQEVPTISEDLKKEGITSNSSIKFPHTDEVSIPVTEKSIQEGLKRPIWSSFKWWAVRAFRAMRLRKVQTA